MSNYYKKIQSLIDDNKEEFPSNLYLMISNLCMEKHMQVEIKKIKDEKENKKVWCKVLYICPDVQGKYANYFEISFKGISTNIKLSLKDIKRCQEFIEDIGYCHQFVLRDIIDTDDHEQHLCHTNKDCPLDGESDEDFIHFTKKYIITKITIIEEDEDEDEDEE